MNSKTNFLLRIALGLFLVSSITQAQTRNSQSPKLTRTHKPFVERQRKIPPVGISPARSLVTVGDTLYMLNDKRQILWKWDAGNGEDIMDQPFVDSHGNIFLIADDGLIFSLNSNGKVRWRHRIMGAYFFTQLKPYQNDQFLVIIDASSYREDRGFDEDDSLSLYKDEEVISSVDFPRNAILQVRGNLIYAIVKNNGRVRRKEIKLQKGE